MPYTDLREWIQALERAGELKRITAPVSPHLEMAEIADRAAKLGKGTPKAGGPALLFENVVGYPGATVLMNQFGSLDRMKLALNVDSLDAIAERIRVLLHPVTPVTMIDKLKLLPKLAEVGSFFPKVIPARQAACKQVIHKGADVDLNQFPILQTWPHDGGRFITLPCVITRDPKSGKRNVGMYRMQVYDGQTTGMHWQRQKVAAEHMRDRLRASTTDKAAAVDLMALTAGGTAAAPHQGTVATKTITKIVGDRMEVAVAIGTDPAITFSAIVPAPPEVEEYLIAGFLRQKPVELVKAETVDLEVPAHAEIILEGYVNLGELRTEGPFGDHTGFYTMQDDYPVFHVTCITHRKNPVWAATVVGKPPMEDAWMGKAVERIFLPLMQLTMPEIVDVNLPAEGVFHNLMIVAIRKSYAGHARKVMSGIWAMGQAMFTKCIIVVDEDCDVQDVAEVTLRTANNIDPERDIQFTMGPVDSLDHASRLPNYGSKMGIDATRKWAAEGFDRVWPPMLTMPEDVKTRVDLMWKKLGID
ncbi:4-hydroxy-3-polyprenylbenzoate decarboxylase [Granulicella pectinivorans]|uniref:4-hydroxy-3-polyprenylbenzoate decarboxylase n=1 Tax=Granulicella pectinivorans TaxID=474950 RepID=A0A1I6MHA3_9BACT|nr:UbiD family decarboxylase [Granulicella pectinivorans]SFS15085.1 4-hydroxy-3-polyprenylbenzoate decarboxylase [Granulicella pectinivorans]